MCRAVSEAEVEEHVTLDGGGVDGGRVVRVGVLANV
jgi:hypothetical protein